MIINVMTTRVESFLQTFVVGELHPCDSLVESSRFQLDKTAAGRPPNRRVYPKDPCRKQLRIVSDRDDISIDEKSLSNTRGRRLSFSELYHWGLGEKLFEKINNFFNLLKFLFSFYESSLKKSCFHFLWSCFMVVGGV